jgi:hypothetical protein
MRRARITVPFSVAGAEALPDGAAPPVVVPAPIDPAGPPAGPEERERLAVAYTPDAKAKGLDVVVAGWAAAAIPDARLAVFGIDPDVARAHLRRSGVPEPGSLELRGTVATEEFRTSLRRARVYVSGARWEDWGQAPLQALADGALLATVPSGGPYEALRLVRGLEPSLVAADVGGAALARAVRAAFELPDAGMRAYQSQAAELTRPFRSEAVQETVTRELLPALLAPTPPRPPAADGAR